MIQEQVILNERGVLVSTTRFVAPQATYAMATVSSLRLAHQDIAGGRALYVILAVAMAGLGFACLGASGAAASLFLLGSAALAFMAYKAAPKRRHFLFLVTNAGEAPGLVDDDGQWIQRVHDALMQAIIARG